MIDCESGVIGSLLIDPVPVLPIVRGQLTTDDFSLAVNKTLFEAACRLSDAGKAVDAITICRAAKVSSEYVLELMNHTPTAANVEAYIAGVKERNTKRQLEQLAAETEESLRNGESVENICSHLHDGLAQITDKQCKNDIITSLEACNDFYNYLCKVNAGGYVTYVRSGYSVLDNLLGGGFFNGGLYILAARPGCGKTTFGLQIAERAANAGTSVLFVSLEMSEKEITAKRLAVETGMSYTRIYTGNLDGNGMTAVASAAAKISDRPLSINRRPSASVDEIGFLARQIKGCGLIVIDYLGLIRHRLTQAKLYERISDTSNSLKRLAMTLNVPILCLAQLNREVESRQNNKPKISDLRDSGAIEQDADGILLLYRNMEDKNDSVMPAELNCILGKNRHGGIGEIKFNFYLSNGRILPVRSDGT